MGKTLKEFLVPLSGQVPRRGGRGVSLTELMITVAVLLVASLGLMGTFAHIAKSVHFSRAKTLANNLVQEQIQQLMQKSYYQVLVTTAAVAFPGTNPVVMYDPGYFPPQVLVEGGIRFTRLTRVQLVQEVSGVVTPVAPTSSDTNLKSITVTAVWGQGEGLRQIQIRNIMANPDTARYDGSVQGKVTCGGVPVPNVVLTIAENSGWTASTDAFGDYGMAVFPGNYHLRATATGYFPVQEDITVTAAGTLTRNIVLTAMATRTLAGNVWLNDHLVISRIVGDVPSPLGFHQEWVEIHNPTTWTWTVAGVLGLKFARHAWQDAAPVSIALDYTGSPAGISPGGFYLFANTRPIVVGGVTVTPDAVWESAPAGPNETNFNIPAGRFVTTPGLENFNIITVAGDAGGGHAAGGVQLFDTGTGAVLDRLCWKGNGGLVPHPDVCETAGMPEFTGFQVNEQYLRKASPAGLNAAWGPAYDSDKNNADVVNAGVPGTPLTASDAPLPVVAGTPGVGAMVTATDGLSVATTAVSVGSPAWAQFTLPSVATGTWTVFVTLNGLFQEIDNVTVPTGGGTLWIPDGTTVPSETAAGQYDVHLTTPAEEGYVMGTVRNILGSAISPAIAVTNGLDTTLAATGGSGAFFFGTVPSVYTLTFNPNRGHPDYVESIMDNVTVALGAVTSVGHLALSQGGGVRGFVSRDGVNPLPGVAISITDSNGMQRAQSVSGSDGRYYAHNLSTGIYVVSPTLSSKEISTPGLGVATVTVGTDVFVTTFTVSGALGAVQGSVRAGGQPIRTGVAILVSTGPVGATPPALSAAQAALAGYYMGVSLEDGTYRVEVPGSTGTYRVSAYYPLWTGAAWNMSSTAAVAGVSVTAGAATSGIDFSW